MPVVARLLRRALRSWLQRGRPHRLRRCDDNGPVPRRDPSSAARVETLRIWVPVAQPSPLRSVLVRPTPRRLLVASPFVAVAFVLVAMAIFFMHVLSAARAYVGGESLWSKGQKQAVQHLERYAQTRTAAAWLAYQQAIAVPLGDRVAREELEKPSPDYEVARQGLLAGGEPSRRHRRHDPAVPLVPPRQLHRRSDSHLGRGRRIDRAAHRYRRAAAPRGAGQRRHQSWRRWCSASKTSTAPHAAGGALFGHARRGHAQDLEPAHRRDGRAWRCCSPCSAAWWRAAWPVQARASRRDCAPAKNASARCGRPPTTPS